MKKIFMAMVLCLVCTMSFGQRKINLSGETYNNEDVILTSNSIPQYIELENGKQEIIKVPFNKGAKDFNDTTLTVLYKYKSIIWISVICNMEVNFSCKYKLTYVPMSVLMSNVELLNDGIYRGTIYVDGYTKNGYGIDCEISGCFYYYVDTKTNELYVEKRLIYTP